MQAATNGNLSVHSGPYRSDDLLPVSKAAKYVGVCSATLRAHADQQIIPCLKIGSLGARRFRVADLNEYAGIDAEEPNQSNEAEEGFDKGNCKQGGQGPRVAIAARVSSSKQGAGKESDLSRQIDKLYDYCEKRWGHERKSEFLQLYSRKSSGMNFEDKTFIRMIRDIQSGKFDYLIIMHKERLCRFGFSLVELICQKGNCEIVIVGKEKEEEQEYSEELAEDLLAIITTFSARHYGRRSKETCQQEVSPKTKELIEKLRRQNNSMASIVQILARKKLTTLKETPITRHIVKKYCEQAKIAESFVVVEKKEAKSIPFEKFASEHLEITNDEKDETPIGEIRIRYDMYCAQRGVEAEGQQQFGKLLNTLKLKRVRRGKKGTRYVVGAVLMD